MQYNVGKNKIIKIIYTLVLLIFCYFIFSLASISYGTTTYTYKKETNDLPIDFDTTYSGYRALVETIVTNNPNWTIKLLDTELDYNTVLDNESGHGNNLVHKDWCTPDWICSECGTKAYDTGNWYCASRNALEYIMDPRNFLNNNNIFQFLQLSNDTNITKEQVTIMASKIDYLNNQQIIDAIYEAAAESNVNPFYIIGKILQEQGSGASALCSGNGYNGQYVGYYNLFNVGASGNTEADVIINGLSYAVNKGWDTPKKAILGGITTVQNYINRGQNTTYFQKYNVVYDPYYSWQYAQNVLDARSVAINLMSYYKTANLLDSNFTFIIPLYKNMLSIKGEFVTVNVDTSLTLRDAPNGNYLLTIDGGTIVLRTEQATEKVGAYYWDKVITIKGTGYMARINENGSKTWLVPLDIVTPPPLVPIVLEPATNYSEPDENNTIKVEPDVTVEQIQTKYPTATIVDKNGSALTGSTLIGTGAKITIQETILATTETAETIKETIYTVIKLGDVNGDGKVKANDYVVIKNHIMEINSLDDIYQNGADVNKDGKISASDYVLIKNYIMLGNLIKL